MYRLIHISIFLILPIATFGSVPHSFSGKKESMLIRKGKDYALFFAVDEYEDGELLDLNNPILDANRIAIELESRFDFEVEVVKNPSYDEIIEKLDFYYEQFEKKAYDPNGQLLIFFSGHGSLENQKGFFLPKDAKPGKLIRTGLEYGYWREYIDQINCKHIFVAIDACYSGSFDPDYKPTKSGSIKKEWKRPLEINSGERLLRNHNKYETRFYFSSGTIEKTPDRSEFAKQFLMGLRSQDPTHLGDQILTSTELWTFIESAQPRPDNGDFGRDDGGTGFLFVLNNANDVLILDESPSRLNGDLLYDKRDGQQYRTIVLKKLRWMSQNLNFDIGLGAYCYGNREANCSSFGRLFKWEAAQKACEGMGNGWRLPTIEEWEDLIRDHGGSKTAFSILSQGNLGLLSLTTPGVRFQSGGFKLIGRVGYYWSDTQKDNYNAYFTFLSQKNKELSTLYHRKEDAYSCRCVQEIKN